ncbi:hypothetical protein N182_18440 [Sinorhizobium sp. GL2]|nr:hypothetical protein N182_18440 [Sinorhizobium sp. GL2]
MIAIQILFATTMAFAFPLLGGVALFCEYEFRRKSAEAVPAESVTLRTL